VEATTLDQAVDSLLAPQENSEETVEATEEPTQDVESDFEDDAADEEVIEASDDDGEAEYEDDATEYTDEVEAVEDDSEETLYDITIDGKPERWTLSQLKQSAAGQGYIQQKMRENAERSKQIEAAKAQLAQQLDVLNTLTQQAQNGELAPPKPPSKELLESDPIGYMQEKEAYETAMGEYNVKMQQVQQLQAQRAQQSEQQKQLHRQEQMQILQQRVPDFADPQKYEKAAQDMLKGGQEYYGVPQEALMQLTDAVEIEILYDAIRYRRLQANRKNVDQKAKKAKPMVKAGAKKVQDSGAATRRKQEARAVKSGNIRDFTDLLLDPKL
jgi:tRNA(Leu) C34 or U34 (ribose-2'-O)-methylase TrmL